MAGFDDKRLIDAISAEDNAAKHPAPENRERKCGRLEIFPLPPPPPKLFSPMNFRRDNRSRSLPAQKFS